MKAIIYESKMGYTQKYAKMLSKETGIPCYTINDAKDKVTKKEEVIFMSWMRADSLKKYRTVNRNFNVKIVCGVGISKDANEQIMKIREKYNIRHQEVFYLRGGLDKNKMNGIYKFAINRIAKIMKIKIKNSKHVSNKDKELLEAFDKGVDFVKKENLYDIINFVCV